jgi:hypothetical protein
VTRNHRPDFLICDVLEARIMEKALLETSSVTAHDQEREKEKIELLLAWFHMNRGTLQEWLVASDRHERWFVNDPMAAIGAAGLTLQEELIGELESAARILAQLMHPRWPTWHARYRQSA